MLRKLLCLLTITCFTCNTFSQNPDAIEKIAISTDRDVYIAGDRLFCSAKLLNSTGNSSDYLYVALGDSSGSVIFKGCLKITDNNAYSSIYLADTLSTGIYQLVSFTNTMRNYGPSVYARKDILIANRFDTNLSFLKGNPPIEEIGSHAKKQSQSPANPGLVLITDKSSYGQREKVLIRIQLPADYNQRLVSVSVRQKAPVSFVNTGIRNTSEYLANSCYYLPEKSGMILQGELTDQNHRPVAAAPVYLTSEDSIPNLQYVSTNSGGIFRFFLNPYYFGKTLMIKSDKDFKGFIQIDNKVKRDQPPAAPLLKISGDLARYIENSQKYQAIKLSYKQELLKEINNTVTDKGYRPAVFSKAPEVIYPSDFLYLPDFIEISREIIPFLKTRLRHDDYVASMLDPVQDVFTSVYIFVDGVLIENVSQIIAYDSKKISRIEVVPTTRSIGEFNIPSILSLNTVNHDVKNLQWNMPVQKVQADSIMPSALYVPASMITIPRYIPDFRQLLLWEPVINPGKGNTMSFETSTSDCTGEFEVVLTSVGNDGNRKEDKIVFNVKHP